MDFLQTADSCPPQTFWAEEKLACMPCPQASNVAFSDEILSLQTESGSSATSVKGRVVLVNREVFPVSFIPKAIPSWIEFTADSSINATSLVVGAPPTPLDPGEAVALEFAVKSSLLEVGTAHGTVSFGVLDGGMNPGCVGRDATFDVAARVTPAPEMNQLGGIRGFGLALSGIVVCASLLFAAWVRWHRNTRVVKAHQPIFLIQICLGVLVIGTTIIPLSIDDGIASDRGCDVACMATPWLLSMGLTISFAALFSKLWRINKLFNTRSFQRTRVREKDVLIPFSVMFALNFTFLLVWTLADPLRWVRKPVDNEAWNTYGTCAGEGAVSTAMFALAVAVNAIALFLAFFQAYKARNISDEFSESKYLGIALYSWIQVFFVGLPILFLIDDSNPGAKYFLSVALIVVICMSMLLLIFVPILLKFQNPQQPSVIVSGISQTRPSESIDMTSSGIATSGHTISGTTSKKQVRLSIPEA
uniref:G-protein coupled receptors family 3 profile domain-containing protein n=1 Tax=Pseudictyota dubia TaxID=2749911 RepID=A0A7R9Z946_9STRA